jgi:lysophospholipase L1-like esterase
MRMRFGEVTRHQFHDHQDVRQFMIGAALADLDQPIVVIGDSITEMSRLPEMIGDKPVVNAGIGGATISDFEVIAPHLIAGSKPSLIVIALGTNDAGSGTIQQDYTALLSRLKTLAPRLLAVGVMRLDGSDLINAQIRAAADSEGVQFIQMPTPEGSTLADGIHLNAAGYRLWTKTLVGAIFPTAR